MKSLEIVNICLEELLNNKTEICEYDLLKIKQDLEFLEIIKKKKVDVYYLCTLFKQYELQSILEIYNVYAKEGALTMEELLKLKQWLDGINNE
jgi:hypothetical protein